MRRQKHAGQVDWLLVYPLFFATLFLFALAASIQIRKTQGSLARWLYFHHIETGQSDEQAHALIKRSSLTRFNGKSSTGAKLPSPLYLSQAQDMLKLPKIYNGALLLKGAKIQKLTIAHRLDLSNLDRVKALLPYGEGDKNFDALADFEQTFEILRPGHGFREPSKEASILRHALWASAMREAGFKIPVLALLGSEILCVTLGLKLPGIC